MSNPLTPRERAQKAVRLRELAELLSSLTACGAAPGDVLRVLTDDETRFRSDPDLPPRKLAVAVLGILDLDSDECGPGEIRAVSELIALVRDLC